MKKRFLAIILLLLLYGTSYCYEIHFTSPTNGEVYVASATVNFSYFKDGMKSGYYYYAKLITHNNEYDDCYPNTIPQWFYNLGNGTYSWRIELWEGNYLGQEFKVAEESIEFYVKYEIYAANNFGSGNIYLDNSLVSSGSSVKKLIGENVSVEAIDQNDSNGYYRIWNTNGTNNSIWFRNGTQINGATSRDHNYTVTSNDNGITLIAEMKKVCDLEFSSASGTVYVNGSHSSPYTTQVVEQNQIYATGDDYSSNGLDYRFYQWTDGSTTYPAEITASVHNTFTAEYKRYPSNDGKDFSFNGGVGDPINITWTDHPNTGVTEYQIWRKVKHNGVLGSATLLATVDKGVETYTDYEYKFTNGYTDDMLYYDARAYYSPDNTYSDPEWNLVYGEYNNENKVKNDKAFAKLNESIPENYSISNYPNPFNPTTTINYQLPQDGFVTLKVYDILGKEVASLVNENKPAGYYNVNFDASRLTSGIYIYTINVNNFIQSKKMLLVK